MNTTLRFALAAATTASAFAMAPSASAGGLFCYTLPSGKVQCTVININGPETNGVNAHEQLRARSIVRHDGSPRTEAGTSAPAGDSLPIETILLKDGRELPLR